eukprot:CAMPEP_0177310870 /NCGR_PEP_ID=MMETSP0368-20130122/10055_1 /TAXON_ID=447022 ORGANISM="Scrippsiella hangoei-like, Strain SHHI-4" /NCGR_SAMPLE_ID=MMETSP0368 /ASSEMBLY_ACC=CAM_ASM_000363 /LENGTH=223 /DNA_ID=CAMNT_0018769829 /DNA_START=140 /DNA_END=808 /DNA_ORIENTATION=+
MMLATSLLPSGEPSGPGEPKLGIKVWGSEEEATDIGEASRKPLDEPSFAESSPTPGSCTLKDANLRVTHVPDRRGDGAPKSWWSWAFSKRFVRFRIKGAGLTDCRAAQASEPVPRNEEATALTGARGRRSEDGGPASAVAAAAPPRCSRPSTEFGVRAENGLRRCSIGSSRAARWGVRGPAAAAVTAPFGCGVLHAEDADVAVCRRSCGDPAPAGTCRDLISA